MEFPSLSAWVHVAIGAFCLFYEFAHLGSIIKKLSTASMPKTQTLSVSGEDLRFSGEGFFNSSSVKYFISDYLFAALLRYTN